jgi:hypothetical protein
MIKNNELWVFDIAGKRVYELTEEVLIRILIKMEDLYFEWIIDYMREEADDEGWDKVIFIASIDNELYDLKRFNEEQGIHFMKSLLRDIKIESVLNQKQTKIKWKMKNKN